MMTIELWVLTAAAVLQFSLMAAHGVHIFLTAGMLWGIGRRDVVRTVSDLGRRIERTMINNMEGLAVFVPLVLVIHIAGVSSALTQMAVQVYFAARVAFAIVYISNIPVIRTAIWLVGQACLVLLVYGIVTGAAV